MFVNFGVDLRLLFWLIRLVLLVVMFWYCVVKVILQVLFDYLCASTSLFC